MAITLLRGYPRNTQHGPPLTHRTNGGPQGFGDQNLFFSDILVPSRGCTFGASTPSLDGTFNYTTGLAEYETAAPPPAIQHFYNVNNDAFFPNNELALLDRYGKPRSLVMYNWKPDNTKTWRQIADGQSTTLETSLRAAAIAMKRYKRKFFLAIQHEPDDDVGTISSGNYYRDFVDMYRYVIKRIRDLGVSNMVSVMNYMGYYGWAAGVDLLYPGDDVVDWIAYDPYGFPAGQDPMIGFNQTNSSQKTWPGWYSWCTRAHPDKPIMVGEMGVDNSVMTAGQAAAIFDLSARAVMYYSQIRCFVYWNDSAAQNNKIETNGTIAAAYNRFASHPYFNQVPASLAP